MCGCNEVCAGVYENVCTVFVSEHVWVSVCMNVGEFGCQNVYDFVCAWVHAFGVRVRIRIHRTCLYELVPLERKKKKGNLITLKTSMLENADPGSFYSRVKSYALISSTSQN